MLLADAFGDLAHVEVGRFGTAVHERFSKEKPGGGSSPDGLTGGYLAYIVVLVKTNQWTCMCIYIYVYIYIHIYVVI